MSKVKRLNFTVSQFESVVTYASEHGQYVRYTDYAKLEAEAQALREEVAEYEALCNRQAELLSQSIVAIRGPEPELTRWGYADLPLRVKTIVEEVAALRARVAVVPDASTVYAALDARERLFTSPENIQVALEAQSRLNGLTVSEGLLRRLLDSDGIDGIFDAQQNYAAHQELRALLSEQA
ncbi:hypothetical protein [Pseudomonas aeruginosa]|uniref:hypothetical protein n=1 Tax=Pseudomonas aeruginosa TaxID=287 RepID=UPI00107EDC90|nr:hypothetical protein [Pseudomonas aeruginosa]TGA88293.1 hypothetical protein E4V10_17055 [Pseudomonas aeruginosa]